MKKEKKLRRKGLIKRGAPHPTNHAFKFDSAHLTEKEAEKAEHDLLDKPSVVDTRILNVPKQHLLYGRSMRITPKRPKLKR